MKKYPKLKYPAESDIQEGDPVIVTEKLDGANGRFTVKNGEILFGSRNVEFKKHGDPLPPEECNKQFQHAIKYVQENINLDTYEFYQSVYGDLTIYGECMHKHSIDYEAWEGKQPDIDSDIPNFVVFDIYSERDGWLSYYEVNVIVETLGLDRAPEVDWMNTLDLDKVEIPQSEYREPNPDADNEFDQKGLAEGVVLTHANDPDIRAKIVSEKFKEVNHSGGGGGSNKARDTHEFVEKYITLPRVRKHAHKLIDQDLYDSLRMDMMKELHETVWEDAVEESREYTEEDLSEEWIRSQANSRMASHLQKIVQES